MSFSPQLFLANVKLKEGLAKPSRFEVVLPIPPYVNNFIGNSIIDRVVNSTLGVFSDITNVITGKIGNTLGMDPVDPQSTTSNPAMSRYLALQCEASELPGKSLDTQTQKIYGPSFKVPYRVADANDTALTFLCTNEFYERKLFERWMECMIPSDTNNARFPKGASSRYMTNIKIIQYDDFIKQIFAIELIDAFPVSIAPQALSWTDDNFHRLTVNFAYQRYKVLYNGTYDLQAAATSLFGVAGTRLLDRGLNRIFTR